MLDHKSLLGPSDLITTRFGEQKMHIQATFLSAAKQKRSRDIAIPICRCQGEDVVRNKAATRSHTHFYSLGRAVDRYEYRNTIALACRRNHLFRRG